MRQNPPLQQKEADLLERDLGVFGKYVFLGTSAVFLIVVALVAIGILGLAGLFIWARITA